MGNVKLAGGDSVHHKQGDLRHHVIIFESLSYVNRVSGR
jgi:hypothetical protein